MLKIFLICNVVACGAFYISDNIPPFYDDNGNICTDCHWIENITFNSKPLKLIDAFTVQYTYSLYWASTTMISIGYGDITPRNPSEIAYTIVVQFASCLLYGYSINEIWSIIQ